MHGRSGKLNLDMPKSCTSKLFLRKTVTIFVLCLNLTGCVTSSDSTSQTQVSPERPSTSIGTQGQLISIQSDNVRAAGYDEASMVMTVQFDNGALYEYYGVPADLWTSFVAAQPHPWSQVGYPRLVQGGIPYKRVG
jgi:hypothetical protein